MHPWETALVTYAACVGLNVLLSVAAIFKYAHFRKTSRSSLLVDALLVTTTVPTTPVRYFRAYHAVCSDQSKLVSSTLRSYSGYWYNNTLTNRSSGVRTTGQSNKPNISPLPRKR